MREVYPQEQAYRDLARLRSHAIASILRGTALPDFVSDVLPAQFTQRLQRAVAGCQSAYEVRMIFASVQEHQLVLTS